MSRYKVTTILSFILIGTVVGLKIDHPNEVRINDKDCNITNTAITKNKISKAESSACVEIIPINKVSISPIVIATIIVGSLVITIIMRPKAFGIIKIPDQKVGIVIKKFGKAIPNNQLIARNGEAGPQGYTLSSGLHWPYLSWIYNVQIEDIIHIKGDEIGWIEAKDGIEIERGRIFGKYINCENFQNGDAFLNNGGERGKQSAILTTGKYRINSILFNVNIEKIIKIEPGEIGLVEALDGAPIERGRSFAKAVECNNFQNEEDFFIHGGQRGNQLSILNEGYYQINPALFKVVVGKKIHIKPGMIGLVEAQDGMPLEAGQSFGNVINCDNFQDANKFFEHGGQIGKQLNILRTGNYHINTNLFHIRYEEAIKIGAGEIGLVEALIGKMIPEGKYYFGKTVDCNNFQDAENFIKNSGQKGKQLATLNTGIYYINTFLFKIRIDTLTEIGPDEIGIVTANDGRPLETGQTLGKLVDCQNFENSDLFINNGGQVGVQISILQTGNYHINTDLFDINKIPLTAIEFGKIGLVDAKDGVPLKPNQLLGAVIDCNQYQNAQAFLDNGGQKGKQLGLLTAGKYKINLNLFDINIVDAVKISPEEVGLVEAKGGAFLKPGQTFGKVVECNDFQDAETFLLNGGQSGKQLPVLTTGTYYINTYLFDIQTRPAIRINTDQIGIVEANAGEPLEPGQIFGRIVECNNYQDGRKFFENKGQRGKQLKIITAGIYQINTDLFSVYTKPLIVIKPEEIGLVEAKHGAPLDKGSIFGKVVDCNSFQDPQMFFDNGGERGRQLSILQEGTYYINTELFIVKKESVLLIGPDEIGLVIANDGKSRERGQILAQAVDCESFQDSQAFFNNGGQKGKQISILTAGKYRINTDLFTIITKKNASEYDVEADALKVTVIDDDKIGIVTTFDGQAIKTNEIAGPNISGHEKYQNPQIFIDRNGQQGLQEEILPSGRWNLNPWFVKVTQVEITNVPDGYVGVIKSYVGKESEGKENIVSEGYKGIWKTVKAPGKYPINTATKDIVMVPTNDMSIRWSSGREENKSNDRFQKTLHSLNVSDKDGFTFEVEVTQVFHILPEDAPEILCNVASGEETIDDYIKEFLEPTVVNYFLKAAQQLSSVDFQQNRSDIQDTSKDFIKVALKAYKIQAKDTLLGEIKLPERLAEDLRTKKREEIEHSRVIKNTEMKKDKQKHIEEYDKRISNFGLWQQEQKNILCEMQRVEKSKDENQKIEIETKKLDFQVVKRNADNEQEKNITEIRSLAKKMNIELDLLSEENMKRLEINYKQNLSSMDIEKLKTINELDGVYSKIHEMDMNTQREISKSLALVASLSLTQRHDIEKLVATQGINFPDNPNIVVNSSSDGSNTDFSSPMNILLAEMLNNKEKKANSIFEKLFPENEIKSLEGKDNLEYSQNIIPTKGIADKLLAPDSELSNHAVFPMYLLLDLSSEMSGECIDKINQGLNRFSQNINNHYPSTQLLNINLITFSDEISIYKQFWKDDKYKDFNLEASGSRKMGKAINLVLDEYDKLIASYQSNNILFHKPWIFLVIGGVPTDAWHESAKLVQKAVDIQKFNFFVVGVQTENQAVLRQIATDNVPPLMLNNLKFDEFFDWLSKNISTIVTSKQGSTVNLSPITTWAQIN